ncbi:MAG: glycosyltransferase family 4 protein [Candidatus Omnitrophica bacterium]|nr:glycosyltransferase family 4 protein [Candidatus Omnitrophota bacterium]MDD5553799.1 glycosyltransferase family 4 protein [Candidatus Omnitrophota bacterium]
MLNICIISREYPVETGWGGIGNYTYYLAHALSATGCEVHVITQSLDIDKDYLDGKVYVHRVAHKTILPLKGNLRELCLRLEYGRTVYIKLKEIMKKFRIDIVEAPNLSAEGFFYSLFRKTPLVTRLHTHFSEVIEFSHWPKTIDRHLSCLLEEAAILRSDLVTCSTRFHAETVFGEIGPSKQKIEIIPLGVPLPQINEDYKHREGRSPVVLFVGRLEKRKGAHILIKAIPHVLKKCPEATFNIIGRDTFLSRDAISFSGDESISFKLKLIDQIPDEFRKNVNFLGHVERQDLNKYYNDCDIFVAPSLYESFGLIYIEAMAHAKPVIGCGVGGVPEVIEDGVSGILVPPEDHISLAKNIMALIGNNALRKSLGEKAREKVENSFTDTVMAERTLNAYKKILN